jgi:hypothetical protein
VDKRAVAAGEVGFVDAKIAALWTMVWAAGPANHPAAGSLAQGAGRVG